MNRYSFTQAVDAETAVREKSSASVKFIAGGTNLVDLMKYNVERPERLVDINKIALREISEAPGGSLRIGALVTNSTCAYDERIGRRYPLLRNTILSGASPQLRNAATTGGNLLQRTRCYYFYDVDTPCNKRQPGSGCPAIGGVNRIHAILGTSASCIATNPSDMSVAMAALGAMVNVRGPGGERVIPILDFHRLPGDTPEIDTSLKGDELITSVDLPDEDFSTHYTYLKLRDRASYAFALVSVAAALRMDGEAYHRRGAGRARRRRPQALAPAGGRGPAEGCRARPRGFRQGRRRVARGCGAANAERLQDPVGASRHRSRAEAGRRRHAAAHRRQDHRLKSRIHRPIDAGAVRNQRTLGDTRYELSLRVTLGCITRGAVHFQTVRHMAG